MSAAWLSGLPAWLSAVTGAVFGLLIGSFLNVVIYRLPKMLERQWAAEAQNIVAGNAVPAVQGDAGLDTITRVAPAEPFNLLVPRSRCPACGHPIAWYENIPVFSYLALRGRCSACHAPIGARYPLVELLTGLLFAVCAWRWGLTWTALAWCGFTATLVTLAGIDWDTTLLPDDLTLPLLWAGLIVAALGLTGVAVTDALWGAVAGYVALWAVYWVFKLVTGKEGMGYGDFKLFAALGAWFGWQGLLPVILLASVVGIVAGLALKATSRLHSGGMVPFGPFLALGGLAAMLIGPRALLRYAGL
ncbi:MAG: prepilin peptidase [Burkholderiaceae bacterium]|jgi:leader peptidase (prepilin peptidase)/N-methyltransferase|nr:prepilin peptidase [Burkholderiaceae bacterium]